MIISLEITTRMTFFGIRIIMLMLNFPHQIAGAVLVEAFRPLPVLAVEAAGVALATRHGQIAPQQANPLLGRGPLLVCVISAYLKFELGSRV